MAKWYASLQGPLLGYYFPLPLKGNTPKHEARILGGLMLNGCRKLKPLWCAIYDNEEVSQQITQFGGERIRESLADAIDFDWEYIEKDAQEYGVSLSAWYSSDANS